MDRNFTTDRTLFEAVLLRWHTFATGFLERARASDWKYRAPEFIQEDPESELAKGYAQVLHLQSATARKFFLVVQFEPQDEELDDKQIATAWMQDFGDSDVPEDLVDLLQVNYFGDTSTLSELAVLFEEFIVNDASRARMEEVIRQLGLEPLP